jgi:peroxiredoxin
VLPATDGTEVDVSALTGRTVLYLYPMTGTPGEALPDGWDDLPGARGCTPQACAFREHKAELDALGAQVYGLSAQSTAAQQEAAKRLHLPYPLLSDEGFRFAEALKLPTFELDGQRFLKRVTLILQGGNVEHVFYPVFPPNQNAAEVVRYLKSSS